jgi:crotonobetainyl-CoA:carnitine CoA-transferase CaiB-like acyl-CoA transferase
MDALSELRVLELGEDVSNAYAARLLADLGADVVKVEAPGQGDALRTWGPFVKGREGDKEAGGLFRYLNMGKRSVALDLGEATDRAAFLALVRGADLIIASGEQGWLEALSCGFDALKEANPNIALCRVSGFGQTGPWAGRSETEFVAMAAGGWVSAHGRPTEDPVQCGGRLAEYHMAGYAAATALTAVRAARDTGEAVEVDVCGMEAFLGTLPYPMLFAQNLDAVGLPPPQKRFTPVPGALQVADGWVGLNALTAQSWVDICTLLEVPEFSEKQKEIQSDPAFQARFFVAIQGWLDEHTMEEAVTLGQAFRIPSGPLGNGASIRAYKQHRERPFFVRDPSGDFERPGFPFRMSETGPRLRTVAPALGADTEALRTAPWAPRERPTPTHTSGESYLPFKGLRVLDLGTFWAGPYLAMYLATLGADVVKVESIQRPDGYRFIQTFSQFGEKWYEMGGSFQATNLGKREITLDLGREEGREIFRDLVRDADILIENFSPRVMTNFGLGWDELVKLRPELLMVRMPGFGLDGPWRDWVAYALVLEQVAGMCWVTGHEGGDPLNPGGFLDCVVSMHAATALQAALLHREKTGRGQLIEMPQLETAICLTAEQIIANSMTGEVQGRHGNRHRIYAPQGSYPGNDERWISLSVRDDAEWARVVEVLGAPAWAAAEKLATAEGRRANHDEIDACLRVWTSDRSADAAVEILQGAGIPVVKNIIPAAESYGHEHLEARGWFEDLVHPFSGEKRYPLFPFRFSFGPERQYRSNAPTLGQHNDEILGSELGLAEETLAELREAGIIGEKPAR